MSAAPSSLLPWKHVWSLQQAEAVKGLLDFHRVTSPWLRGHVQPAAALSGRIQPCALTAEEQAAMLEKLTAASTKDPQFSPPPHTRSSTVSTHLASHSCFYPVNLFILWIIMDLNDETRVVKE